MPSIEQLALESPETDLALAASSSSNSREGWLASAPLLSRHDCVFWVCAETVLFAAQVAGGSTAMGSADILLTHMLTGSAVPVCSLVAWLRQCLEGTASVQQVLLNVELAGVGCVASLE